MTEPDNIIEIRDPEIDVESIMQRIRERVQRRRELAQSQGLDYDRLTDENLSGTEGRLPADLYYELHQLCTNAEAIGVSVSVRDRHLPLLNPIFFQIEKLLHRLAVKYVNMLAGRQITLNRSTAQILAGLMRAIEEKDVRLEAMEKELAALRERLEKAEGAILKSG